MVAIGSRIWQRGVEKVLAFRTDWMEANSGITDRLLVAMARAAAWCDDPANREELAELLGRPTYVGRPASVILPALGGDVVLRQGTPPVAIDDFMLFARESTSFPWRSQALWIYSQMVRWRMVEPSEAAEQAAAEVFRSDIYRRALADAALPMPGASMKVEGSLSSPLPVGSTGGTLTLGPDKFFDGRIFDPSRITEYLATFGA